MIKRLVLVGALCIVADIAEAARPDGKVRVTAQTPPQSSEPAPRFRRHAHSPRAHVDVRPSRMRIQSEAQRVLATNETPAPARNFLALDENTSVIPPDTNGAAGPNHLMTVLKTQVRIQTKDGANVSTTTLDTFMSGTGVFDPKVIYDAGGGRWIVVALEGSTSANSYVLLAVSNTSDPTGSWTRHRFLADQGEIGAGGDYPSIGLNGSWIVLNVNMYEGSLFVASEIVVIEKAPLYAGTVDAVFYLLDSDFNVVPAVSLSPSDAVYLVSTWTNSALAVYTVTDEWLIDSGYVEGSPWHPMGGDLAPQLGSSQKIDAGDDRILNAVYRNGAIYATHTVFFPLITPTYAAAQWWRIPVDNLDAAAQHQITNANFSYAYPSIAVNDVEDVLVGFSSFASTQYASAAYSLYKDGVQGSVYTYKQGLAPYFKSDGLHNRWGDYSATCVDPANDRDFWTIQEYASTPGGNVDRWGTWWANVVAPADAPVNVVATATSSSSVFVTWGAVSGASSYEIARNDVVIGSTSSTSFTDTTASPNTTYFYKVRVAGGAYSDPDHATTILFTDDPLTPGTIIKKAHVTELRNAVNSLRAAYGLGAFSFQDDAIVRAVHMTELRNAVSAALPGLTFTDGTLGVIKAIHFQEIRDSVK